MMRYRALVLLSALPLLAACGGRDADYYAAHLDEARDKLKTCSRADIIEDRECGAAAHAVARADSERVMTKIEGEMAEHERASRAIDKCNLVAAEDRDACVARVAEGTDPGPIVLEKTGFAAQCSEPPGETVQAVAAGAGPVSDCARTFEITLPEAWQWRPTRSDQQIFIGAPNADAESMRTAQISTANVIECSANSGSDNKEIQREINARAARFADYLRKEAAKGPPREAAFFSVTEYGVGPATAMLRRELFFRDGEAQVEVSATFRFPGRQFRIHCSITAPADNPRIEDSPLIAMMEQIAKSLTPINLPKY